MYSLFIHSFIHSFVCSYIPHVLFNSVPGTVLGAEIRIVNKIEYICYPERSVYVEFIEF